MTDIVNYIWMRKDPSTAHAIPTHLFYNFQENAAQYPDAQFRLWVENARACADYKIPRNATVRLLESIPAFSTIPIMSSPQESHLWAKVDIARLLVLERALKRSDCATAFYADFDIDDIQLHSRSVRERLKKYGVAFGASFHPDNKNTMQEFENGYLVFTQATTKPLDFIISRLSTKAHDLEKVENRNYIFGCMKEALNEWALHDLIHDQLGWSSELGFDLTGREPFPTGWPDRVADVPIQHMTGWQGDTHRVAQPADTCGGIKIKATRPAAVPSQRDSLLVEACAI